MRTRADAREAGAGAGPGAAAAATAARLSRPAHARNGGHRLGPATRSRGRTRGWRRGTSSPRAALDDAAQLNAHRRI